MKTRVLMVCLGNICRSPLAEGILQSKLNPKYFEVASAGTSHWHVGESPDPRSIEIAKKYGIDISNQKGQQFQLKHFETFDLIYVMDEQNKEDLLKMAPHQQAIDKVHLILNELVGIEEIDVPDPYYGTLNDFENVFKLLEKATDSIAKRLLKN